MATHHGVRVSQPHAVLLAAYEDRHGTVYINSGQRTMADQWRMVRQKGIYNARTNPHGAAVPSPWAPHIKSGHVHHALDGNAPHPIRDIASFYRSQGVPVAFNVSTESWHMDTLDEGALKRAAAKLGGHTGDPVLKQGQTGPSVVRLKKLLYDAGVRNFTSKRSSSRFVPYFSKYTASAVRRFQKAHGLKADGIVGSTTWAKLRTANH